MLGKSIQPFVQAIQAFWSKLGAFGKIAVAREFVGVVLERRFGVPLVG